MANLRETSVWEAGIYQWETSDPVMGGENGIDNKPTRQLANRTLWLKNEIAKAVQSIGSNKTAADSAIALKANHATQITAGAGLTGGGDLSANRTIGLATPSTLSGSTANWVGNGATGHTHEIAKATPTQAGVVKLVNALNSTATDAALTAAQGKELAGQIAAAVSGSLNLRGTLGDTLNLNDLTAPNHVGVWQQTTNAYAVPERNYPVRLAGTLLVLPAVGGGTQIYIQYSGFAIWLRTQTSSTSGWSEWRRLGDDKLGNSGNQTLNGTLTFNNPNSWAAWYAPTRSGQWRFETNPVGDTAADGKRFNFVFTGADNAEKARVAFVDPEGTQTVAYQSWVKEQIIGSDPVNRSGIDLDTATTPQFFINASNGYVSAAGTEHAGLVLGYRSDCTQLIAAGGNMWVRGSDHNPISDPSHWSDWYKLLDNRGVEVLGTADGYFEIKRGSADFYLRNRISGKYMQFKDNGTLVYNGNAEFTGSLQTTSTITSAGDVVITGNKKTARFGMGAADCFIHNPTAKKYLQLKDNGELAYSDDKIILQSMTASTQEAGIVQLSDSVTSTSITTAATAKAVKAAYDKANDANNNANSKSVVTVMTGTLDDGGTIPLPSGYSEAQCRWLVSVNDDNINRTAWDINENSGHLHYRFECYTTGRVVKCRTYRHNHNTDDNIPGRANYIIIGVK